MVELHHALAVPLPAAARPGITVDHRDLVPPPRQRDRGIQPGRPRPDDNRTHEDPPLPPVKTPLLRRRVLSPGTGRAAATSRDAPGNRRTPGRHHPRQRPGIPRSPRTEQAARHLIHPRPAGSRADPQPTRVTQPPVHGLDDDPLRNGTEAPCEPSDYRQVRNPHHGTRIRLRLSCSTCTFRWSDNPIRGRSGHSRQARRCINIRARPRVCSAVAGIANGVKNS